MIIKQRYNQAASIQGFCACWDGDTYQGGARPRRWCPEYSSQRFTIVVETLPPLSASAVSPRSQPGLCESWLPRPRYLGRPCGHLRERSAGLSCALLVLRIALSMFPASSSSAGETLRCSSSELALPLSEVSLSITFVKDSFSLFDLASASYASSEIVIVLCAMDYYVHVCVLKTCVALGSL